MAESLKAYRAKRDFTKTSEPSGETSERKAGGFRYLIQKHDATRLHYDFRLELDGVLLSWAVTRGPSLDPHDKRLAVHVEDHPLDYGDFEGTIPKGEYGGGTVMLWDEGTWEPVGDPRKGMEKGELKFILHGERLKGKWVLIRLRPRKGERSKHDNWLLIKERDEYATEEKSPLIERALTSVRSDRTMEEIASGNVEWSSKSGPRLKAGSDREDKPAKKRGKAAKDDEPAPRPPKLPAFVDPQLCTLVDVPPAGDGWVHEIKYDGYRMVSAVAGGEVAIYTRKGLDWTAKFPLLVRPTADLPCRAALLDGEIAVTDGEGHTSFGALQDAIARGGGKGVAYYLFDLLHLDGKDLRSLPLLERKRQLAELLKDQPPAGPLFYSDHVLGHGAEMFKRAADLKLEGIISKRADSSYKSGRTKNWLKIKIEQGQEFIIIGWRPSDVAGRPFSSLLLAVREGDRLIYAGRVGSGFGERELKELWPELKKRQVKHPPVDEVPREIRRDAHFVKPELVAEIAHRGLTDDNVVRQAAYKSLRKDKRAAEVVAEIPKPTQEVAPKAAARAEPEVKGASPMAVVSISSKKDHGSIEVAGVRLTNPDRVLFPGLKVTKKALAEYYLAIADRILPHVAYRPLSLVRCPDGVAGDCFFQKHASRGWPPELKPIRIREKTGSDDYLYIEDERGLVAAVQMGVFELHIWGSHVKTLEQPDRLVFDFDPDEDVPFGIVRDAAKEMRERLKGLGLESFPMTTGGKGIHVVVPLTPRDDWDAIRTFAEAIARVVSAENPDRYLAVASKAQRKGKIFVDYLRNGRGATAIGPYSSRARRGASVAWPVTWSTLGRLENAHPFTVETAATMLKRQKTDPWKGYFDVDQILPLGKLTKGR